MKKSSTKRIVISGWYGNKNIGDEAQLSAMVSMIRRLLPDVEITVLSDNPKATINEHGVKSIRAIKRSSLEYLREIAKADLFILGGGTLLYDVGRGATGVIGRLIEVILAKVLGTPVMYFNGGIGLIYNKISKYYMKCVCNAMDLITVRDELSKMTLRSLGITKPVHVGADSAFSQIRQFAIGTDRYQRYTIPERPKVGVNVRHWIYKIEDVPLKSRVLCENFGGLSTDFVKFERGIAAAIDYLKQVRSATITLFPISFLKAEGDYDVEVAEDIAQLLSNRDSVTVIKNECTYMDMIEQIREFDLVIGMRLHALIFAAMLNVPMLAINYDSKVASFMKLIQQEEYLINMNEVTKEVLCPKVDQLWERREAIAKQLEEIIPKLASKSEKSGKLMVALLNKKRSSVKLVFEGIRLLIRVMLYIPFIVMYKLSSVIHRLPCWISRRTSIGG